MITAKEARDFRLRAEKHAQEIAENFLNENESKIIPLISNYLLDQAMNGKKEVNFYSISSLLSKKVADYKDLPLYATKKLNKELKKLLKSYDFKINDDIVFWG